jgi:hypothetical protein
VHATRKETRLKVKGVVNSRGIAAVKPALPRYAQEQQSNSSFSFGSSHFSAVAHARGVLGLLFFAAYATCHDCHGVVDPA